MQPEESTSPEADESSAEATREVAPEGLLCISCGYDLRALPIDAKCPECGTLIRRSLAGDRLAGAEPNWLRMVTRGQQLIAWGWLCMLMFPAVMIATIFVVMLAPDARFFEWLLFELAAPLFTFGGLLLCAVGVVLVTMQDPRESLQEVTFSSRRLARIGMISALILFMASLPVMGLATMFVEVIRPVVVLVVLAAFTVGIVSYLRWVAKLLNRVPKDDDAKQATWLANFLRWALPLTFILMTWVVRSPGQPRPQLPTVLNVIVSLAGCAGAILWLLLIVKSVSLAVLLFHAAGAFSRCMKQAIVEDEAQKQLMAAE